MSRWPQKFFVDLRRQEAVGNFLPNQFWPCITFNSYYHCVHLAFSSLKKEVFLTARKLARSGPTSDIIVVGTFPFYIKICSY